MALSKLFRIESRCRLTSAKSKSIAKAVTASPAREFPYVKAGVIETELRCWNDSPIESCLC